MADSLQEVINRGKAAFPVMYEYGEVRVSGAQPRRVQDRAPAITLNERFTQSGTTFGPFVMFTGYRAGSRPCGRMLYLYLKAGDRWYLWKTVPQTPYNEFWYAKICQWGLGRQKCTNPRGHRTSYCGRIQDQTELRRQAVFIRGLLVDEYLGAQAQGQDTSQSPFGSSYSGADAGTGTAGEGRRGGQSGSRAAEPWWKKWVLPAAAVAGVVVLKQRGVI
jgi:hypothetical protein